MLLAGTVGGVACGAPEPLVPASDEPLLYLVLHPGGGRYVSSPDSMEYALLLTTGTPLRTEYRAARRFEMRRGSDGALFAWRATGRTGLAPFSVSGANVADGNYTLAPDSSAKGLGTAAIEPGETYDLLIETGGVVIHGRVTLPDAFTLSVTERDGRAVVTWPHVAGDGGYTINYQDFSRGVFDTRELVQDTFYTLPAGRRTGSIGVVAYDENMFRFLSDEQMGRSGIDHGYGIFGGQIHVSLGLEP